MLTGNTPVNVTHIRYAKNETDFRQRIRGANSASGERAMPGEAQTKCVLVEISPAVRHDAARARRAKRVRSRRGIIPGAEYELVIMDSGCTGCLVPEHWCGKTATTILVPGSESRPTIEFSTADKHGKPMKPVLQGELTGVLLDDGGKAWVIHWPLVYVMSANDISEMFLSPSATREAWMSNRGVDEVRMTTGTPRVSQISLPWRGERGHPVDEIVGVFGLDVDALSSTYYAKIHPVEALLVYDGDDIIGDVGMAIRSLEHEHRRHGKSGAEWVDSWVRGGRPRQGAALARAYREAQEKSEKWDASALTDDALLREYELKGVCAYVPTGVSRSLNVYNWVGRRDHENQERCAEVAKAREAKANEGLGCNGAMEKISCQDFRRGLPA